jgi:hypothetical protein
MSPSIEFLEKMYKNGLLAMVIWTMIILFVPLHITDEPALNVFWGDGFSLYWSFLGVVIFLKGLLIYNKGELKLSRKFKLKGWVVKGLSMLILLASLGFFIVPAFSSFLFPDVP